MMNRRPLASAVLLPFALLWLASGAAAQTMPAMPVPPAVPMPSSPRSDPQPPDGITVRGSGTADVQATTATLSLFVGSHNNNANVNASSLAPIVDALVRAGVPRNNITLPIYMSPATHATGATITATVQHPTVAMIQNGIASLASTSPLAPDLWVNNAQVRLTADDCSEATQQAQAAALRQARANAQSIARQIGKRIGAVLAVDTQNAPYNPEGQCSSGYSIGPYQNMQFTSPQDYLRVRVYASVTMRFAIR